MKISLKQILIAAAAVIVAASAVRACGSRPGPAVTVDAVGKRVAAPDSRGSGGGFFGFFDWFTGGDAPREAVTEGPEDNEEQPRLTSELNDLADKIESAEKLPDSVWYPNSTNREEVEKHSALLREFFLLGNMVRTGSASPEQKARYIEMKMKILQDKIEMIRQFQDKAGGAGDREEGDVMVRRLEREVSSLGDQLRKP
jgi:hypothetical protein